MPLRNELGFGCIDGAIGDHDNLQRLTLPKASEDPFSDHLEVPNDRRDWLKTGTTTESVGLDFTTPTLSRPCGCHKGGVSVDEEPMELIERHGRLPTELLTCAGRITRAG